MSLGFDRALPRSTPPLAQLGALVLIAFAFVWPGAALAIQGNGAMQIVIVDPGWRGPASPSGLAPRKSCAGPVATPSVAFPSFLDIDAPTLAEGCEDDSNGLTDQGLYCKKYEGGFDHVVAGEGLRNTTCGTIELAGSPGTAMLAGAWLYVGRVEEVSSPVAPFIDVRFNGVWLHAELIGRPVDQPCWDDEENGLHMEFRAYRATVTLQMLSSINGKYEIEVPPGTATSDASDPWTNSSGAPPLMEGASLVAVYADYRVPKKSRVTINEGPAYLWPSLLVKNPVLETPTARDTVRHSRLASDGQLRIGGVGNLPVLPLATRFGVGAAWEFIAGPNSERNPLSDFGGEDGGPMTQLHDSEMSEWFQEQEFVPDSNYWISYEPIHIDPLDNGSCVWVDCINVIAHVMTVKPPS